MMNAPKLNLRAQQMRSFTGLRPLCPPRLCNPTTHLLSRHRFRAAQVDAAGPDEPDIDDDAVVGPELAFLAKAKLAMEADNSEQLRELRERLFEAQRLLQVRSKFFNAMISYQVIYIFLAS